MRIKTPWETDTNLKPSRRQFLRWGRDFSALLALSTLPAFAVAAATQLTRLRSYPFTLGVASGDPTPDSVILWTRLDRAALPDSVNQRDGGTMIEVAYEVATTDSFDRIVRSGSVVAAPELGYSAHAEIRGLEADQEYFYRWVVAGEFSPVGRSKTAPLANVNVDEVRFAIASCQQYEHGFYTAYQHMAQEDLDLIVHLGDYIYESSWGSNLVRAHEGPEIITLEDYRARYTTYRSDTDLQAAHARAPWVVTWDDHEVDNNYAASIAEDEQTPEQLLRRRAAGYQAFYEFMPIRLPVGRQGPDMPIHRRLRFGNLMEMSVLDTRQYRDDQACGDGRQLSCSEHQNPNRSLLGAAQKNWLFNSLATTDATWNVLAQQIMMASLRSRDEDNEQLWSMDIWDGYPFERQQLLDFMAERSTPNPVVLTGDIHSNWAADLKQDFDDENSATIGSEFVGTSITSGGDGRDSSDYGNSLMANNPHVKFYNGQRGYLRATLTPQQWRTDYKILDRVTVAGEPLRTRASYVVEAGRPGVQEA